MAPRPLARLRRRCLALPEAHEVETWGAPTFRVRNKLFAMYASADDHHGGGRPAVWLKAAPGNQDLMVRAAPHRFFVPPYVGPSGWIGVWLDDACDWAELPTLVRDSYRLVAPKRVAAQLDGAPPRPARPADPARPTRPARPARAASPTTAPATPATPAAPAAPPPDRRPVGALRNLGPASAAWLEAVGIRTAADLRRLGAVAAFRRVAFHRGGDVSLNLLYALEGALRDVRWDHLPPAERRALRAAAEAAP